MDENKFWLVFFVIIASFLAMLTVSFSLFYSHQSDLLSDLVKNGANPVTVSCVFYPQQDVCKFAEMKR